MDRSNSSNHRIGFRQSAGNAEFSSAQADGAPRPAEGRLRQVQSDVRAAVEARVSHTQEANKFVQEQIGQTQEESSKRIDSLFDVEREAQKVSKQRHETASLLNGLCGSVVPYSKESPDDQAPYKVERMTLNDAIGRLRLMTLKLKHPWLWGVISFVTTLGMGLLLGLNLGAKSGWIEPELAANFEPDRLAGFGATLVLGVLLAVIIGFGVKALASFAASQRNTRGWSWATWVAILGHLAVAVGLMVGDALLQMTSLQTVAQMTALSGESLPAWVYFVIGLIFAVGYIPLKSILGAVDGLNQSAHQLAAEHIDKTERDGMESRKNCPKCREASSAIAAAKVGNQEFAEASKARQIAEAERDRRIQELAGQIKPLPTSPTPVEADSLKEAELRAAAEQIEVEDGMPAGGSQSYRAEDLKRQADEIARRRGSLI